jgi:DNA-binding protein HU-beta
MSDHCMSDHPMFLIVRFFTIYFLNQYMAKAAVKQMTKAAILDNLAGKTELTKRQVGGVLDALNALAYKEAKKGFTVPGLGKLVMSDRKARMGRNPQTGEAIKIPARKVVRFRVGKQAKDAILGVK